MKTMASRLLFARRAYGVKAACIAIIALSIGDRSYAAIPNGGFEVNTVDSGPRDYLDDVANQWSKYNGVYSNPTPDMFANDGVGGSVPGGFSLLRDVTAYEGNKFAGLGAGMTEGTIPGFSEGIASTPVLLTSGKTHILQLAMLYDTTNDFGYVSPAPLTVRLRQGAGAGIVIGSMAANAAPKTWQLRTLNFQVAATGQYEIVLSNESGPQSYLGVDDVRLVPEPTALSLTCGLSLLIASHRRRRG